MALKTVDCPLFQTFGCICLSIGSLAHSEELIALNAKGWKYWDSGKSPGKDWADLSFDDSAWKKGPAPLGYGNATEKTEISFGDNPEAKHICAFFRREFQVKDPSQFKKLIGQFQCDDGCVIYLNGKEVFRHNVQPGELQSDTPALLAISDRLERDRIPVLIDPKRIVAGKNVIAVRVHQVSPSSSDLAFAFSLMGTSDAEMIAVAGELQKKLTEFFVESAKQLYPEYSPE